MNRTARFSSIVLAIGLFGACKPNLAPLEERIAKLEADSKAKDEEIKTLKSHGENYETRIDRLNFIAYTSGDIVTDSLVGQRVYLGKDTLFIDVRPQPSFASHVLGQGRFNIPDRELKATILEVIEKAKMTYEVFVESNKGMTPWDKLKVEITQNNFDVGKYANGALKLKGE